jgi:hypothetical protein
MRLTAAILPSLKEHRSARTPGTPGITLSNWNDRQASHADQAAMRATDAAPRRTVRGRIIGGRELALPAIESALLSRNVAWLII